MGAQLSDVQVAQAYDDTSQVDLSIVAFRLPGKSGSKLSDAIVDTWLSANVDGVKKSDVTLGGKKLTKIDYGDQGTVEYVYTGDDYVIVIDTSDPRSPPRSRARSSRAGDGLARDGSPGTTYFFGRHRRRGRQPSLDPGRDLRVVGHVRRPGRGRSPSSPGRASARTRPRRPSAPRRRRPPTAG